MFSGQELEERGRRVRERCADGRVRRRDPAVSREHGSLATLAARALQRSGRGHILHSILYVLVYWLHSDIVKSRLIMFEGGQHYT